jgi:stearoyl-CoA desaturase (delta-9 desaturase)
MLAALGLARVKKLAPRLRVDRPEPRVDVETLRAMISSQWHVLADYAQRVVARVHRDELRVAPDTARSELKGIRRLLSRSPRLLGEAERRALREGLAHSRPLTVVYDFQQQLRALFLERAASQERLLNQLQEWCRAAEATGITALVDFAARVRGYALRPV